METPIHETNKIEYITDDTERITRYEKTRDIVIFKAKSGKSITLPITKEQFEENSQNGKLILNVSINGLKQFLESESWTRFGMNRIREI